MNALVTPQSLGMASNTLPGAPRHSSFPGIAFGPCSGSHLGTVQGSARARGCDLTGKTTLWDVLKGQGGGNSVDMSRVLVFISRARWVWVNLALLGLVPQPNSLTGVKDGP